MEYLSRRGVFTRLSHQEYGLNEEAGRLRDDHPDGLRFRLDLGEIGSHVERAHLGYVDFARADTTSASAYEAHYGTDLWTALADAPALAASWDRFMSGVTSTAADHVVTRFDWTRRIHLLDVGGGSGTLLRAVLGTSGTSWFVTGSTFRRHAAFRVTWWGRAGRHRPQDHARAHPRRADAVHRPRP